MTMHETYSPGSHRHDAFAVRPAVALAIAGCAMVTAACGSSGGGLTAAGATNPTGNASPLGLSQCMRAHGISNFPDPSNGGLTISATPGDATLTVQGITFSGPAFQSAEQACKKYLMPGGRPPQPSAAQRARFLAFAKCMRASGVPTFSDPVGPVQGAEVAPKHAAANAGSPAFRHAAQACGGMGKGAGKP
jgi:hypothetical protein